MWAGLPPARIYFKSGLRIRNSVEKIFFSDDRIISNLFIVVVTIVGNRHGQLKKIEAMEMGWAFEIVKIRVLL